MILTNQIISEKLDLNPNKKYKKNIDEEIKDGEQSQNSNDEN